jgi:hypothetical protein
MNKSRMKKNAWSHVRMRPVAKRFYGADGPQLPPVDDDWLIRCRGRRRQDIQQPYRPRHAARVGPDSSLRHRPGSRQKRGSFGGFTRQTRSKPALFSHVVMHSPTKFSVFH